MFQSVNIGFPKCVNLSHFWTTWGSYPDRIKFDNAIVFGAEPRDRFERQRRLSTPPPSLLDTLVKHIEPAMTLSNIEDLPLNLRKRLPKVKAIIFDFSSCV